MRTLIHGIVRAMLGKGRIMVHSLHTLTVQCSNEQYRLTRILELDIDRTALYLLVLSLLHRLI